jgi:hypothetical protein
MYKVIINRQFSNLQITYLRLNLLMMMPVDGGNEVFGGKCLRASGKLMSLYI